MLVMSKKTACVCGGVFMAISILASIMLLLLVKHFHISMSIKSYVVIAVGNYTLLWISVLMLSYAQPIFSPPCQGSYHESRRTVQY
jgi:flagellar biosynthesis component FlhA